VPDAEAAFVAILMSLRSSRPLAVALVTLATFADILAYSIAVPVLPDISERFGASPTVIGLLFASFGLTVLLTSVPMGAISDRTGRKLPLIGGLLALSAASVLFAFAPKMSWLFAARLVQGAADAVTWVVGFAVVADLYNAEERGRIMGLVMSGTTFGFMIGPSLGGWLYETGGPRLPYLVVAGVALINAAGIACLEFPAHAAHREAIPLRTIVQVPAVAVCAVAVAVGGGTIAMMEPVLSLFLADKISLGPARIGLVFGAGAIVAALLHPVFGRIADRTGGRRLTLIGLGAIGAALPMFSFIWSFGSAVACYALGVVAIATMVTPSLAYMAEATTSAGIRSFGVAYGLYNFAWATGLLVGPAAGGYMYERLGLLPLSLIWAASVLAVTLLLTRAAPTLSGAPAV
jgi:MFS transporter, DHA1 family, solute carrier family 18 (vesicular amine transporter), member 1/2